MLHSTKIDLSVVFLLSVALHVREFCVQGLSCGGLICANGGTVIPDSENCHCKCLSETTGLFCEYNVRESSFPAGTYAIPVSKDGCPESRAHGWGAGYINITTKLSLYDSMSYPNSCQEFVEDEQFILKPNNPSFKTNILGPFDRYTVQLNFCFKFSEHIISSNGTWPQGNYGVFGTDKGCPAELSSHVLTICFPPLLHYNIDGHVPYLDVLEVKGGTELQFNYCRHEEVDAQDNFPLDSFNPYMMIKDPEPTVYGCPKMNGYEVIDERFPGPMPTTIQGLNTTYPGNANGFFPLSYCHAIPQHYNTTGSYVELFYDDRFSGSAFPFVEVMTEQFGCDNFSSGSSHFACKLFPTWIMIDIRRAVLVSAIMISNVDGDWFFVDLTHIYVGNQRWGALNDGALLCRHTGQPFKTIVNIFTCYSFVFLSPRPQHGRFVTLVRRPYTTTDDDWDYSSTFITILSYNSTEVNAMETKYKNRKFLGPIARVLASVTKYTDTENKVCRQELGMENFGIWDTQLTASSWQPSHQPRHARPQLSGWCAESNDVNPYLQVDLVHVTLVDGIVIVNWYELIDFHDSNIYKKEVVTMGPLSFHISYGSDLRRLQRTREYTYDISRKLDEPQTFIFSDPFLAKYLQIYPNHFPSTNVTCIKFEILGCRISDSLSLDCENSSSREISHARSIFVPNNKRVNIHANLSNLECEVECLHNKTNCISAHYNEDGSCLLYTGDESRNYITVAANDSRDVLSMVTCLIDEKKKAPPTKIISNWKTYKKIAFTGSLILTNVEYPFPYTYNSVYTWKIDFTEKYVILQFLEISFRTFTNSPGIFFNDIVCRDTIFIGEEMLKPVWNPFDISNITDDVIHYRVNSNYTGRSPAYSIGETGSGSFYITFHSCSAGTSLNTGRGFRVHLSGAERPFCLDNTINMFCLFPEMELVSHRFLGRYDMSLAKGDFQKAYSWTILVGSLLDGTIYSSDSLLMSLEFMDFDISCHSESILEIINEFGKKHAYCNDNRHYGKQLVLAGPTIVIYKLYQMQSAVKTFFPEGFHLSYRCIPKQETLPYNLSKHTEDSMYTGGSITRVCADGLQKCYTIRTVTSYSWEDVAKTCEKSNSLMVNIKNLVEMSLIRSILIDHYREKQRNTLVSELFIGLRRYIDSSGIQHEHWTDGTPLTFTAWDDNEPSDTLLNQCTKMGFHLPSDNSIWRTQPCKVQNDMKMTAICEQTINVTNTIPTEFSLDADNTEETVEAVRDLSTIYKCSSGEWTSSLAKCNDIRECFDSSDEMQCNTPDDLSCTEEEFTCPDGRCIHVSKVCNFVEDCVDAADEFCEFPSCTSEQYKCASGQCIWSDERCDSIINCLDASDEIDCDECSLEKAFQCGDKSCISARLVCDMHIDCPDGSDEVSCDHEYKTCDDLWRDGYIHNGYFHIEQSYHIYCVFDTFGKDGNSIIMRYLNTDWKQLETNQFRIKTTGIKNALDSGYTCTQKFSNFPHRERLKVMELDNKTFTFKEKEYQLNDSQKHDDGQLFGVRRIFDGGTFSSFILTAYDDFNTFEDRLKVGNVECIKWIAKPYSSLEPSLFCRHGVKSVNESHRCLYSKDKNDVIDGCRSFAHLQNCENFTCPQDYVKCPDSFCIPLMYVCNGRMDCPDGFDEKLCACKNKQRKVIILTPVSNDGRRFHEIAARLGGSLFTENSSVKIFKYEQLYIPEGYLPNGERSMKPIITLQSSDILSNSEYSSKPYKSFNLNKQGVKQFFENFFLNDSEQATLGVIWLTDEHTETFTENIISSQLDILEKTTSITVYKYRVVIDRNSKTELFHSNKHNVTELYVRNANILGTIGTQFFPQLCKAQTLQCNGSYRCLSSKVCIPVNEICDNQKQCPYGDDEDNCDFKCPKACSCGPLIVDCSNSKHLNITFNEVTSARILDISNSTHICKDLLEQHATRQSLKLLILLNMSRCEIKIFSSSSFDGLYNLKTLDLTLNKFIKLPTDVFNNLKVLENLRLNGNHQLMEIEPGAFNGISLNILTISYTKIHTLSADTFKGLQLEYLDLTYNEISSLQDFTFNSLESNTIDLRGNPITQFTSKMFAGVINVKKLKTPAFKFCCIRPSTVTEEDCLPYKDEFSSCDDLMRNGTLQALMWTIGVLALLGNVSSLVYRLVYDRRRLKLGYGIFVTNLAIADLFMGVYMLIIAVADKIFRNRYIEVDEYWRNSVWCQLAGVLSTVSSEASVLFMCLITVDRILVIKYPFGQFRFKEKSATCASVATWVFVLIMSLLPVLHTQYFEGKFYGKSAVCLALPLTRDRPPGWLYSTLLFIGFNMLTFVLIAVGQLLIYAEIKKQASVQKSLNIRRTNDLKVARNLLLIVTTDFLCWFPIGMMGSLALAGQTIPGEVYAWTAVFVLPINSALNPFMYTLTAIYNRQKFSPSVEEQSRTDLNKEMGKTILKIYPYVPTYKMKKNSTITSLRNLMENRRLTPLETAHLANHVIRFIKLLHDHDLVIRRITEKNVFITLVDNGQAKRRIHIDVQAYLNTTTKKTGHADNVYDFGCLVEKILYRWPVY